MQGQDDVSAQERRPSQAAPGLQGQSSGGRFQPALPLRNVPGVSQLGDAAEAGIDIYIQRVLVTLLLTRTVAHTQQ